MDDWYDNPRNLHDLCEHLVRQHGYDVENVLEVLDKPQHWTPEWETFTAYREGQEAAADDARLIHEARTTSGGPGLA